MVSLEVYGDSLTVADSPSFPDGETGPRSWVHHLGAHRMRTAGNRFADPSLTTDGLHLDTAGATRLAAGMAVGLRRIATQAAAGGTAGDAGAGERPERSSAPQTRR